MPTTSQRRTHRRPVRAGAVFASLVCLGLVACNGGGGGVPAARQPVTVGQGPADPAGGSSAAPPTNGAAGGENRPTAAAPAAGGPGGARPESATGVNGPAPASPGKPSPVTTPGSAATPVAPSPRDSAAPDAGRARAAAPGAPGDRSKPNYASDVGVTADTIRIGTINMTSATRSLGPAIGGVQEQNLDAAVKYINRTGGVAGRKVQLVTCDDGGDIARGRACYEKLKSSVFALVPSVTWLTDVIHDRLPKDKVPWLSWGWFKSEYEDPWMFPCHANGMREASAVADWAAKVLKPATVGIMYLNVSEDIAARDVATRQLERYGITVVTTVAQEWDSADESQHVLAMRAANPDFVMSFSWAAPVAKFMHDASAQKWAPRLGYVANHLTGDPGYGPIFGDYIKDKVFTITSWGTITGPDPDNPEGATPEMKLMAEELLRTNGREYQGLKWRYAGMHHTTQSGWVCTRILAAAAAELGPDLTRDGLRRVLESRPWDSGMGVTMYWSRSGHDQNPYSYNREFIYKWVTATDGGWDLKRTLPDPVYDCRAPNIPAGATTDC